MKLAGLLLLLSGWGLVLAALPLLGRASVLAAFVLAGTGVEILGLVLLVRSHMPSRQRRGALR